MAGQINDFIHKYVPPDSPDALTLLLLHGTGGDESSLISIGRALAPGAGILSPRGRVLEGQNPRFFRRLAEGVYDLEDLDRRTHELADWIDTAAAQFGISLEQLVAVGYSNGANIAASVLLHRPESLRRAVLLRPMLPVAAELAPDLNGTQVLILAGIHDPIIPLPEAERLAADLARFGAAVIIERFEADHRLTERDLERAQTWLRTHGAT